MFRQWFASKKKSHTKAAARRISYAINKKEAMTIYLPEPVPSIILDYLNGDISLNNKKPSSLRIFGRNFNELIKPQVTHVSTLILNGEEEAIEEALQLVTEKPFLLRYVTIAKDPLGRSIQGTPFQMAVMAGDVDYVKAKHKYMEAKNRGLAERLILSGRLTKQEVKAQLQVICGKKATLENKKRNDLIFKAITEFGNKLMLEVKDEKMSLENFKKNHNGMIRQLEQQLEVVTSKVITLGYILDFSLLQDVTQWLSESGLARDYSSIRYYAFAVYGLGNLQRLVSSRHAQIIYNGAVFFVLSDQIPPRSLHHKNGHFYYSKNNLYLGSDFYLNAYGKPFREDFIRTIKSVAPLYEYITLLEIMHSSIERLPTNAPSVRFFARVRHFVKQDRKESSRKNALL